jgi:tetratricopeptide (TPR) repeat protein
VPTNGKRALGALVLLGAAGLSAYFAWRWSAPAVPNISMAGLDDEVVAAIQQARAEVIAAPRSAAAWGRFGTVVFAQDMYAECPAILAEAERLDPTDARWPYLRGLALILQRPAEGIVALQRAAKIAPGNPTLRLRLAEESLKLDRVEEADLLFRDLLVDQPDNPRALLGQGQILSRRGQWLEALAPLNAAAAAPTARRSARAALAETHARMGNAAAADAERKRAAEVATDIPWPDPLLAEAEEFRTGLLPRIEQALALRNGGRLQEALVVIAQVLRDHPNSDDAHLTHAKLLIAAGATSAAEDALRRALALNSDLMQAHYLLAQTAMQKKDYAQAERSLARTVELMPTYGLAHYQLGRCRLQQGDRLGAKSAFGDAVRCRPDLVVGHIELGALLLEVGEIEMARIQLEHAVRLDPSNERSRSLLEKIQAITKP